MNLTLIGNDAQDEDFELGLAKKDLLPTHEERKNSQEGSETGPVSKEGEQGVKQAGRIVAEPCLEQNKKIGSRTDLQTGAGTSSETRARTAPEQCSPESRAREESVAMDAPAPCAWKRYRSHP